MYKEPRALILRKQRWGDYFLLRLKSAAIASQARPGQFLMVRVSSQSFPLLRRPFSIHATTRTKDAVEIFFARTGLGTAMLSEKKVGETIDLLGPLGKGFLEGGAARAESGEKTLAERLAGKQVFLVGGGRGIAPLYFLAEELRQRGAMPIVFYGAKTERELVLGPKFKARKYDFLLSTDDGSAGFHGLVSALLETELSRLAKLPPLKPPSEPGLAGEPDGAFHPRTATSHPAGFPAYIFACGPEPMMARVASLASFYGIPARFSLESIMGCGIGACWGCVRKIQRGGEAQWVKVCEEGPVFEGSEIVWNSTCDEGEK